MSDFQKRIEGLRTKVEKLINLQEKIVSENKDLRAANNTLAGKVSKLESGIRELEEKNKLLRLSQAVASGNDQNTRDLKLKVNEYIREIDKCLELINR
jgi:predicted  nucleic acid-binding Zn-ribbon protein